MTTRTSRASKRWMMVAAAAVACGSTLAISGAASAGPGTDAPTPQRISGATRFETAVNVNKAYGFLSCDIVIASGENFPDGLASSITYNPILLTESAALPAASKAELDRLALPANCGPGNVDTYIVGGTTVVSSAQKEVLDGYGDSVRISGSDRYATAIELAKWADTNNGDVSEVLLTTGQNFPDALAGGVLAQWDYAPILLNDGPTVRPDVAAFLLAEGVTSVKILGGTNAVPAAVEAELKGPLGIANVKRISGADRAATAVAVAEELRTEAGFAAGQTFAGVTVVNGNGFADALAAAPWAYNGPISTAPILLTDANSIPAPTAGYHVGYCSSIEDIAAIGGTSVISDAVVAGAVSAATCKAPTIASATVVNSDFKQAVFTINAGTTVTAKAGTAADGAAANGWQVALIQNGNPGTESVVVDATGTSNPAFGGIPTFVVTANLPLLTNAGFVSIWNAGAGSITTAATTNPTGVTGLPATGTVAVPVVVPPGGLVTTPGSQDSTVVVTFDRAVSAATPLGVSLNLNPASPFIVGAPTTTSAFPPATGSTAVTYVWQDITVPPAPAANGSNQIRYAAGAITDQVSGLPSVLAAAKTLTTP